MTIPALQGSELTIGGGISLPVIIERVLKLAGPDPVILATATAIPHSCLAATDRYLFVCTDTSQDPPLVQLLPYERLRLVTISTIFGDPSLSIVTVQGAKMVFRMSQTPEHDVSQLARLINKKMGEYPAPTEEDRPTFTEIDSDDQADNEPNNGSLVGQVVFGVGDVVSEVHAPLGIGLMVGGAFIDWANRATSAETDTESMSVQPVASDTCAIRSDRLDIGGGITNPTTGSAIRNMLIAGETVLTTMQGTAGASLVMTSQRIVIAEESQWGKPTLREFPFSGLATVEAIVQSDPCILRITTKNSTSLSIQTPHRHYNQVTELAARLLARVRSAENHSSGKPQ